MKYMDIELLSILYLQSFDFFLVVEIKNLLYKYVYLDGNFAI